MVLRGILRNSWETFIKVLVPAELFIVWNQVHKNLLYNHQYPILTLYIEIPAAGTKSYEICFQY